MLAPCPSGPEFAPVHNSFCRISATDCLGRIRIRHPESGFDPLRVALIL